MTKIEEKEGLRDKIALLLVNAAYDPIFKKELMDNPKKTIENRLNVTLDPNVEIRIIEDTPKVQHILIPSKADLQLSDEQIEQISGGVNLSDIPILGPALKGIKPINQLLDYAEDKFISIIKKIL